MTITKEAMINYLQQMMDDMKEDEARFGKEDRIVRSKIDAMIACKEMVEAFIMEPVNLGLNGKVTVGF